MSVDTRGGRKKGRVQIPLHLQLAVIERDKNTCRYCGKEGTKVVRFGKQAVVENVSDINLEGVRFYNGNGVIKFEIDHIIPICKGGGNTINNLNLSCRRCNRGKRDRNG